MKKIIIILLSLVSMTTFAQNLSKMSEKERDEKLVKAAKEVIQTYAPDYVKYTTGEYIIKFYSEDISSGIKESIYIVRFTNYNKEEEFFRSTYAIGVHFSEKNGRAVEIVNGHGNGILIPEKPLTRGEPVQTLKYERRSPPKIINGKVIYD